MYEQIRSNKRKTVFIVGFFLVVVAIIMSVVGYVFVDSFFMGLVFGLIAGGIYVMFSVSSAPSSMLRMTNAKQVQENDYANVKEQQVYNIVSQFAMMQQLPMPDVYVIDDNQPNAFAIGMKPENSSVAVTTGLLNRLNRSEIEGVIAHEIAHIQNYDSRLKVTTFALGSFLILVGHVLFRSTRWSAMSGGRRRSNNDSNSGPNAALIGFLLGALILVFGQVFSTLIQMWVSRNREYLADATAAEITRNPQALASALQKISGMEPSQVADSSMSAMYFYNPFKRTGDSLWSTHPSTENRIKALLRH